MKKLFSLLIVFISIKCFGQVYQVLPQYGYEMKRVNATLVLLLPSDTTTNKTGVARIGTVLYIGNGTKWTASTVTDATKLNISDTASMLTPYAKTIVVNTKVNISDTAAMLSNYAKTSAVNSAVALKVNIADTATMLTPYLRKIDTASLSNRINLKANINSPTFTGTVGGITQSMVGLGNVTNESKATMFTNATFTGTFATAAGAIGNASLANGAVANLSGTNTGDQTTITGNAGTATALQTARTIGTTTGDATSAGSSFNGTANNTNALTLATVNSNVGTFTNSTITVNGKGLITAASSGTGVGTVTSVAALTLGTTGTDLSSTVANSTTTPVITLNVPTASATNRGALSSADWTTFNGKESVLTFSSPLVRTTNTISIPVATTSVNGYLSSTDWATFNNKQGTITLTTTGTSGAATFSANTLNIPNYGSALSGYLPLTGGTLTGALNVGSTSTGYNVNVYSSSYGGNGLFQGFGTDGLLKLQLGALGVNEGFIYTGASNKITVYSGGAVTATFNSNQTTTFSGALSGTSASFSSTATATAFIPSGATVPTNGMYLSAANTLGFATNTTNRLTINSSGNLGLGVTPSAWSAGKSISVGSSAAFYGDGINYIWSAGIAENAYKDATVWKYVATGYSALRYEQLGDNGTHAWYTAPSGTASAAITFTQAMTLFSTGNLAIATTTDAGFKFDVNGTGRFSGALTGTSASFSSSVTATSFIPSAATVPTNGMYLSAANTLNFATNTTNRLTINSSGNVGIGTVSPDELLTLSANVPVLKLTSTNASGKAYQFFSNSDGNFYLRNATTSTNLMVVTNSNNVLIGTTTDAGYKLDVNGTGRFVNGVNMATTSGSVGIGTSTPSQKLEVAGVIRGEVVNVYGSTDHASTSPYLYSPSTGALGIGANGATRLTIASTGAATFSSGIATLGYTASTSYAALFNGSVGIGTASPAASSILDVTSTTKGFLPPRMTTTEINAITSPAAGLVVYNTTLAVLCFYDGTGWKKVSHSAM